MMTQIRKQRPGTFLVSVVMLVSLLFLLAGCSDALSPTDHKVLAGETLQKIADNYNVTVAALAELNQLDNNGTLAPAVGSILRIPAPASPDIPLLSDTDQLHVVEANETLATIAVRYKDMKVTVDKIAKANHLTNPNYLRVGQFLRIPGEPKPQPTKCEYFYQAGDNLDQIAARYGVTAKAIMDTNGLPNASAVVAGQKLIVELPPNSICPQILLQGGPQNRTTPVVVPNDQTQIYVVQRGNTLYSIAKHYGTTVDVLVKLNNLSNPRYIISGQQLLVPKQP
jgi:LysM repeat protein